MDQLRDLEAPDIRTSNILKDSVITRRENIVEFLSAKDMLSDKSMVSLRKVSTKQN